MAKSIWMCAACGHVEAKWHGQCPGCGEWNTLAEEAAPAKVSGGARGVARSRAAAVRVVALRDVEVPRVERLQTGIGEFDRVLGGGLVPGSLVLLGGSPGIGKSTLTNMALGNLQGAGRRTLYVSGEESAAQIRLRAARLGAGALDVPVLAETDLETVLATIAAERERTYRTLRSLKNRFGSTNETGVFEMRQGGLVEVLDPSARFVGEATGKPGSVVLAAMEGTRPLLVEVQALVSPSELVPPRRVCNGIDRNRLALVLAVLARHAGVGTGTQDVFVNVVGGVRVDEPGADLAVALAVASAARGVAASTGGRPLACFGEVGLTGELRSVAHGDRRSEEAAKFGLAQLVCPETAPTLRQALRAALGQPAAAAA